MSRFLDAISNKPSQLMRSTRVSVMRSNYSGNIYRSYKDLIAKAMLTVYAADDIKSVLADSTEWKFILYAGVLLDEEYEQGKQE